MTEPATDPSTPEPTGYRRWSEEWWENRKPGVKEHRCTAHRRTGEQCRNPAILGATVCRFHGGAAKQVVHAARVRLQNAAEKMARELLGMATDPNVSDSVKLAAIRDALDRAGLKPVTAVDLEISTKPWEKVFEGVSKVVAGPRYSENRPAIEGGILDEATDKSSAESENEVVVGEFDDDEIDDDPYLTGIQQQRESTENDADVIDVEIEGIDPERYTDTMSDQPTTPDQDGSSLSGQLGASVGPLGATGPVGSGLMSLLDAKEAGSRDARTRSSTAETLGR